MDKYEYKLKTEQMLELMENGAYNKAAEIADTIDWKRVRNATMLTNVSDIYEKNGDYQKSYEVLNIAYHRAEGSRKVIYRLCALALKTGNVDEAIDYYDDFIQVAPKDPNQHILQYKILRARRAPIEQQIEALEEFKKAEYIEEWAYELARLYQESGMTAECLEECDDLILWFSEGKFVFKAMELKMQYKPLTPSQQDKYNHRYEKIDSTTEEIPNIVEYKAKKERQAEPEHDEESLEEPSIEESSIEEPRKEIMDEIPEVASAESDIFDEETEAVEEEPVADETVQRLEQKGIGSRMKLQDALKSLLKPKLEDEAVAAEENEEEPELKAAIEEIESVADLEFVHGRSGKLEKAAKFDTDLEELKAEPLSAEEIEDVAADMEEEIGKDTAEKIEDEASADVLPEVEKELKDPASEDVTDKGQDGLEKEPDRTMEDNRKQADEDQIEGQLSIQDLLSGWGQDESANEESMEEKKKKAEPILPPDIQRMIDEIEGVIPEEAEPELIKEPEKIVDEPHPNMGAVTQQFRIDDIEAFLAEPDESADEDDLPEDFEELDEDPDELDHELEEFEEEDLAAVLEADTADDFYSEDLDEEAGFDEEEELEEDYEEEDYEEEIDFDEEEYDEESDFDEEEYDEESDFDEEEYEEETDFDEEEYEEETDFDEEEYEEETDFDEEEYEEESDFDEEEYEEETDFDEEEYEEETDFDEEEYEEETDFDEEEYDEETDFDEEEYEEETLEDEFRPSLEAEEELDDREIPDEEEMDILSATTPLSRKETAKMIATGKTAPLPIDEISDALSMSNTGFIVHGRYDLETQSGIGTRAGLTDEQKKLFSYFVPVRGMSEQLVDVLEQDNNCTNRENTSRTGNLLIIGNKGNGKTVLAVDVVKAIQKQRNIKQGKVAIVTGDSLNKKKVSDIFDKLYGGALIIEKAGKMNEKTVARLNKAMERETGELLVVLEEQRKPLDRLLSSNREFRRKFTSRLEVPIFINDELVTFGQTYAQENGYRIDEMGILALYSRIDALQREDHAVTVAEVKEVMDAAMEHSQKASAKKLVKRVFGKNTDDSDRIILSEKDFN